MNTYIYLYVICLIVDEWLGSNFEGYCILQYRLTFGALAPRCCAAFLPHTPKKNEKKLQTIRSQREREKKEKKKRNFFTLPIRFFSKLQ